MAEKKILVDGERITYTGYFDIKGIMRELNKWATEKGYDMIETSHIESTTDQGKFADIKLEPFKKLTDYTQSKIKIRITLDNIKDVVIQKDGKKKKLYDGTIRFLFRVMLITDYENRWEGKPIYYFFRIIFEKYIYSPLISKTQNQIIDDYEFLRNNIKSYLNLFKMRY